LGFVDTVRLARATERLRLRSAISHRFQLLLFLPVGYGYPFFNGPSSNLS